MSFQVTPRNHVRYAPTFFRNYRSELLMWLFIGLLVASPVADKHPRAGFVMSLVFYVAILVGSQYVAASHIVLRIIYPLAGLWMLAHLTQLIFGNSYYFSPYIGIALCCAIVWGIVTKFTDKAEISRNAIAEAVIGYLVIAVGFSQAYWMMNRLLPNCFNMPVPATEQSMFLYFSLTTLTTVGSSIEPVNHYVRFVSAFEALAGVFYVAIIIARLVADYKFKQQ